MGLRSSRGAALVIVLFIVALAAILAVEMSANLMVQVQKSTNLQGHQQAKWYAYGAEELAIKALIKSKRDDPDKTTLDQIWAQQGDIPYPVDNGTLSGKITDLQACLNLNAIAVEPDLNSASKTNPAHKALFALLENIEDLPAQESEETMADSVFDWLDENSITYRSGAEEGEYLSRQFPYMTANSLFASTSELRLVKGFNPLVMEKVLPYVCVIPGSTLLSINVNTLAAEQALILSTLIDELSVSGAEAVIAARPDAGFESKAAFFEQVQQQGGQNVKAVEKLFSINSEYFKLQTQANFVDLRFSMTTLLHAKDGDVTILARKFGGVQ
ncbi:MULTISPECIES: type II secretion system minor pseudopilin GspK [Pseudoalteromonas]|jgi:general secretion pathway protein K|uniref:Type II secretion system protein K n=2 Tax=Pseudoalteromonas TaxID=53246 RepID=Q3ILN3_PSET1|nr:MULTISPECIES: type II secretion system minor pseudopilin GspK [Pseudoalteromonas]ASM52611.1 general secretion pathway protein K [Pseudoalteromonas nigrifaciens]MBB1372292.1 type II secretion system minor pseudopilin GspK [Pseudoalteromonas sp. SR45-4]MBB1407278.1 type II secretion system minor pseudopilin GspK [Pseudoalteromonas sp. SG44-5]MBH0094658.1 type II secretion system minor pseudopilin GspK [Pseudoalteromonas sp. SCQQ13]MBO7927789.1 type II secretion system minor pseudopilin GspK [